MANTKLPARLLDTSAVPVLNVTGDLTVDTTTLKVDSSNNRVGIGLTSPASVLDIKSSGTTSTALRVLKSDAGQNLHAMTEISGHGRLSVYDSSENEDIRFDSNGDSYFNGGDVGIGTASPDVKLDVRGEVAVDYNASHGLRFYNQARNNWSSIGNRDTGSGADLQFKSGNATALTILHGGQLCIGKTADNTTADGLVLRKHPSTSHGQVWCVGTASSAAEGLYVYDRTNSEFEFYASYHGTIAYRGLYNMSDERKKENIQDITLGLDAVKELRPVSFDWKNDKGDNQLGFIAQEVEDTSLKQLVGNYKDPNIDDLKSLNKEQMIPVLVKAIQEQQVIIDDLKSRIETLEG